MKDDPIVEEIRKIRHAHAEKFNYDVAAIFEDYRRVAKESGRQHVSFPPRRCTPPNQTPPTVAIADTPSDTAGSAQGAEIDAASMPRSELPH